MQAKQLRKNVCLRVFIPFLRVMDGMTEACMKGGIEACYSSVSCACALLGALDELSQGRGIQPEQVRY